MTKFTVDIVADSVCPWCYVGTKKLDSGIAAYKAAHPDSNDTFVTTYHPFYLNPDPPEKSIDKSQFYKEKFGEQRTSMMFERMLGVGKEVGIDFKFGGKTGNSRDSHRLIQLGRTKGTEVQKKVIEELYRSYFEKEEDITSHEVLRAVGVRASLDEDEVRDWLESEKGGKEVDLEVKEAQSKGVTGVPNFTIQDKFEIGGAQNPEAFVRIFEKIKEIERS